MATSDQTPDLTAGLWESARATVSTIEPGSMSDCLFWEHAHRHQLRFRTGDSWPTEAKTFSLESATILTHTRVNADRKWLCVVGGTLAKIHITDGRATVSLAAASERTADEALEQIRRELPEPEFVPEEPRIPFTFSWETPNGISFRSRTLPVTSWEDVRANYSATTAARLEGLTAGFRPDRSGQTMIWHGSPGTGKTHALRALALAWREWCDVHVVTDPDKLFGADAAYLMELLTGPLPGRDDEVATASWCSKTRANCWLATLATS